MEIKKGILIQIRRHDVVKLSGFEIATNKFKYALDSNNLMRVH